MTTTVILPNGRILNLLSGAHIEILPDGGTLNESVTSGLNLLPGLFSSTNTFYAATLTVGSVTMTPGLFTNSNVFYAANIALPGTPQSLTAPLFSNSNVFYTPTVSQGGTQSLTASLFTNTNIFYSPISTRVPGFMTPVLKNNTGTILSGETGVVCNVYNVSTGALVLRKTGLSSDGNGLVSVTDITLVAGTSYSYEIVLAGGRRLPTVVA